MNVNAALWIFLRLDDDLRLEGASACAYVGMTPEQIKGILDQPSGSELAYYRELAVHLGFNFEKDKLRVVPASAPPPSPGD